ncbi:MAG: SUMF1/EgtB/PvdO family nonheme iron enzyme [Flavobacteriales bacterium]|nr:SUMF1/EgtB/PvdO family nonheme iron enzyme [Flavobacteriales bacterium]MBL0044453.1 SUMF1/EgtB/PvdO family nonheme iron enzyme [Flavobacteriales bacterium]
MELRPLTYLCVIALLASCGEGGNGQLIGAQNRPGWFQVDPYGMNYIPMGAYTMGPSDQDAPYAQVAKSRTVSVQAFYMDQTEISNNEYRQFVNYVQDSIMKRLLGDADIGEHVISEDEFGEEIDPPIINWDERIDMADEEVREALADMFYGTSEQFYRRKEIDTRKLMFEYYWIDLKEAARKSGRDLDLSYTNTKGQNNAIQGHSDRSKFIIKEVINVFPDTLCWVHDFTYAYNEPMTKNYFWHPAYDDYPVVGITWQQANAFNVWRTQNMMNAWLAAGGEPFINDFRLPTEAEWEYAARGGLKLQAYPWGGPYIRNRQGCFLGNFKPLNGNYTDDGGFHTVPIDSYSANDYGLYNMAGNVAEWTSTAFDESVYDFDHDMNSEFSYDALANDAPALKRKVIRGGSFKDVGLYLQTGTRCYEYQDTAKCYVGFRSVLTYLGRGKAVSAEDL